MLHWGQESKIGVSDEDLWLLVQFYHVFLFATCVFLGDPVLEDLLG